MKLTRLDSTTARPSGEAVARAQAAAPERVRRVEAMEGIVRSVANRRVQRFKRPSALHSIAD